MNEKEQLLKEIEQAPDYLVKEVLNFLLFTKNKTQKKGNKDSIEKQLQVMADDLEIQAEIKNIDREFSITEFESISH